MGFHGLGGHAKRTRAPPAEAGPFREPAQWSAARRLSTRQIDQGLFTPWRLLPISEKTPTSAALSKPIQTSSQIYNPDSAKPIQVPAKLLQIKILGFT